MENSTITINTNNGHAIEATNYSASNTVKRKIVRNAVYVNGKAARHVQRTLVPLVQAREATDSEKPVVYRFEHIVSSARAFYSKHDANGTPKGDRRTGVTPRGKRGSANEYTAFELSVELVEKFIVETFGRARTTCVWLDGISKPHKLELKDILNNDWTLYVSIKPLDLGIRTASHAGGEATDADDAPATSGGYFDDDEPELLERVTDVLMGARDERA